MISELPVEILVEILAFLDLKNLLNVRLVNKYYSLVVKNNELWKRHFKAHYPYLYEHIVKQNDIIWYAEFLKADKDIKILARLKSYIGELLKEYVYNYTQFFFPNYSKLLHAANELKRVIFSDHNPDSLAKHASTISEDNELQTLYDDIVKNDLLVNGKKYAKEFDCGPSQDVSEIIKSGGCGKAYKMSLMAMQ